MHKAMTSAGLLFLAGAVFAQQPAAPAFDVASIKPNKTVMRPQGHVSLGDDITVDPVNLTMRAISLQGAIRWAYRVTDYQISGPAWLNAERFDITAKAAAPASEAEQRQMLQGLLADRFALKVHQEKKEVQVYVLLVAKNGPKFHASEGDGKSSLSSNRPMVMNAKFTTMAQLADLLTMPLRAPVIDETGLNGQYDFMADLTSYAPPPGVGGGSGPGPIGDPAGVVLSLVQEQLGLKLESRKRTIDFLVIDHAEKTATEN